MTTHPGKPTPTEPILEPTAPHTLSPIRLDGPGKLVRAVPAEYYNIVDTGGTPLAGLLILFDRQGEPVRAEVQLHDTTAGSAQELALRQAETLLRTRYHARHPLPMYVTRLQVEQPHIPVTLEGPPPSSSLPSWLRSTAILVLVALVSLGAGWFARGSTTPSAEAPQVDEAPAQAQEAASVADVDAGGMPQAEGSEASTQPGEAAPGRVQAGQPFPPGGTRIVETNDLPPSRNAIPLEVGQRAQVCGGCTVYVRSQPGANDGEILGYLESGDIVELLNGPVWRAGESDTIVWWYVRRLSDGLEGWTPANTSRLTLLFPIE